MDQPIKKPSATIPGIEILPEANRLRKPIINYPVIDLLLTVDAQSLVATTKDLALHPGSPASPLMIDGDFHPKPYISVSAQGSCADNSSDAEPLLILYAQYGCLLRWSVLSLACNMDYSVYLVSVNNPMAGPAGNSYYLNLPKNNFFPPTGNPLADPMVSINQKAFDLSLLLYSNNPEVVHLCFAIADNSSGKIIGYYGWEAIIGIVSEEDF